MDYYPPENHTPEQTTEINKNIDRFGEFMQYLINNPLEMEKIPSGCIHFVDDFENLDFEKIPSEENVLLVKFSTLHKPDVRPLYNCSKQYGGAVKC